MSKEVRLARARERVKRWKANHPKSIRDQWARRYLRKKAGAVKERRGVLVKLRILEEPTLPSQETHYEDMALVEGDPEVVRRHARVVAKHRGVGVPPGLMEPELGGGQQILPRGTARGPDLCLGGGEGLRAGQDQKGARDDLAGVLAPIPPTLEEERVRAWVQKKTGALVPELDL